MSYKRYVGLCFEDPLDEFGAAKLRQSPALRRIDAQRRTISSFGISAQTRAIKTSRTPPPNLHGITLDRMLAMTIHSSASFKDSPYGPVKGFVLDAIAARSHYIDKMRSLGGECDVAG